MGTDGKRQNVGNGALAVARLGNVKPWRRSCGAVGAVAYNGGMRKWVAIVCNVIVPGAGLIVLQREWLGATLALVFGVTATVGVWSVWITPASVPTWASVCALVLAGGCWLVGQVVLRRRVMSYLDADVLAEVKSLREQALERTSAGDYDAAHRLLRFALTLNDEDVETNVQLAELLTLVGRFRPARRAWQRVDRLDRAGAYRRHVAAALDRLPAR